MLDFIKLNNQEEYIISGEGLSIVVLVAAGQAEVYSKDNIKLANLDSAGESYTAMNTVLKVKATTDSALIIVGSFPIVL